MSARTKGIGSSGAGRWRTAAMVAAGLVLSMALLGACSHLMMMGRDVEPPPASEFGFGPRASTSGLYHATLEPVAPLRTRALQTVRLSVRTADEGPVEEATIEVDGGMPQHRHGLPTQPRVTRSLGDGTYQVDGVKFNMGGWWELKFRIAAAAGTDSITFNLEL